MTFDDLERSLPNGLHDAELLRLRIDYAALEAVIDVSIDIGDSEAKESQDDSSYRSARITFSGLQFVVIDPPDRFSDRAGVSRIDAGTGQPPTAPAKMPPLSEDSFLFWLFLSDSNNFIRIAARSTALDWLS